jgi:hypothetical protein
MAYAVGPRPWALVFAAFVACHDISSFSTASGAGGTTYEGVITGADFVRTGLGSSVHMCLSIDTSQLQSAPGWLSTDDGIFQRTALRPIPQYWQDPLSTFNFGEGRIENVLYVANGRATDAGPAGDVVVVLSFMVSGAVEVRLLRGAPGAPEGGRPVTEPRDLFGVFSLTRTPGSCPF